MSKLVLALAASIFTVLTANATTIDELKSRHYQNFYERVQLSDGITHFQDIGNDQNGTVLLIHGVSGPMQVWDRNIDALIDSGFRVVRLDLYGRGFSQRIDQAQTVNLYQNQISELLNYLGINRKIHIVGSSMGAILATEYAIREPNKVHSVTLVGPAGFPITTPFLAKLRDIPVVGDLLFHVAGRKVIIEQNEKYFFDQSVAKDLLKYFKDQLDLDGSAQAILSTMRNIPVQNYLFGYEELGQLEIPTHVIWGEDDVTFPYHNKNILLSLIQEAEFTSVDEAAHLPQFEKADEINEKLIRFLLKNTSTSNTRERLSKGFDYNVEGDTAISLKDVKNSHHFQSEFFKSFPETTRKKLNFNPNKSKVYSFPTKYGNVTTATALFTADLSKAAQLLEPVNLKPVKVNGRAMVAISFFNYGTVEGMTPYNEAAISIVASEHGKLHTYMDLILGGISKLKFHVVAMPVTSLENQMRGEVFWGLPKSVRDIRIFETKNAVNVVVKEAGDFSFELSLPKHGGEPQRISQTLELWSILDGHVKKSLSSSTGDFTLVEDYKQLIWPKEDHNQKPSMRIGSSVEADLLKELELSQFPFRYQYGKNIESVFDLPME